MSRQNIYDDPAFQTGYCGLRASGSGLNELLEQPAIDALLPSLVDLDVVDVGCGDGARANEYVRRGAASVLAVDPSERMLADAARNDQITFLRAYAEDLRLQAGSVDVVVASMSLHYVEDLEIVIGRVAQWLRPGGSFVASFEHPIVSCRADHAWCEDGDHWPVDGYGAEGPRTTTWFVEGVIKYHRTAASLVNAFLSAGLALTGYLEPSADPSHGPVAAASLRRPPVLVLRGTAARETINAIPEPM